MNDETLKTLQARALDVRRDVIRMVGVARSGHLASSLSLVDLLVYLYWQELRVRSEEPQWPERDRFVMGKRNGCPALYTVLAHRGFFPREELWNFRSLGGILQHHPHLRRTPGVDAPTGSSGLGLGLANGLALGMRKAALPSRVFCLVGDSELETGVFWESVGNSSRLDVRQLILLADCNVGDWSNVQGRRAVQSFESSFRVFGWDVFQVDGHSLSAMEEVFGKALADLSRPVAILVRTCLGKGVTLFEGGRWPHSNIAPGRDDVERALRELNDRGEDPEVR